MSFICHSSLYMKICGSYRPTFAMKIAHNATLNAENTYLMKHLYLDWYLK